jgi:hypothetical protein
MNKSWFYLGLVGSLVLAITSCGDGGKPAATPAVSPSSGVSPAASPNAVVPPAASTTTPVASSTPATAATPPKPTKPVTVDVAAGLIAPTDADNWTKTVSKGRSDPFATLSLRAIEVPNSTDPLAQISNSQKSSPKITTGGSTPVKSGANKPLPGIKVNQTTVATVSPIRPTKAPTGAGSVDISRIPRSGVDRKLPNIIVAIKPKTVDPSAATPRNPTSSMKPVSLPPRDRERVVIRPLPQPYQPDRMPAISNVAPTPSEPTLARTVGVSGVIEVAGKTQVIVRLPNESFSRYVEVGDRIYDGRVKIKRIEGEQTLSPMVILEESGVEVTRKVGDIAGTPIKEAAAK